MPEPDPSESAPQTPFSLPPLAQLGAVTGRFVHDLSNEISSAATVMSLIHDPESGPPSREDLDDLNNALERAVALIHLFGGTVRSLRPPPDTVAYGRIFPGIEKLLQYYGTPFSVADGLTPETEILCHPDWLIHCLEYTVRLHPGKETRVRLELAEAKSVTPPVDYYSIDKPSHFLKISTVYPADAAIPSNANSMDNQPYFIVRELMRHMRGFLLFEAPAPQNARLDLCFSCLE